MFFPDSISSASKVSHQNKTKILHIKRVSFTVLEMTKFHTVNV